MCMWIYIYIHTLHTHVCVKYRTPASAVMFGKVLGHQIWMSTLNVTFEEVRLCSSFISEHKQNVVLNLYLWVLNVVAIFSIDLYTF